MNGLVFGLGALFVATGATGLLVEQIFEKLLTTVVGASTPAGAIVLAVYFGGISIGGIAAPTLLTRVRRPALAYALLEAGVGVYALLLALFWSPIQELSAMFVVAMGDAPATVFGARLVVAMVWILPPTMAMGATFPALVGALQEQRSSALRTDVARFYALNLLGAAVGAGLGPFVVFPTLGLTGTLFGIVALQAVIVVCALVISRRAEGVASTGPTPSRSKGWALIRKYRLLPVMTLGALSGFVVFSLEVVWLHLIGAVIGMSVYAFGLMLTNVLLGLFFGGGLISALARRQQSFSLRTYASILIIVAVVTLVVGTQWDVAPNWFLSAGDTVEGFAAAEQFRFSVALVLVGLPSVFLGLMYPALFRLSIFPTDVAAEAAGVVGASNAVGSISGALLTGFVLIPSAGSNLVYHLMTVLLLALAGGVTLMARRLDDAPSGLRFDLAMVVSIVLLTLLTFQREPWDLRILTSGTNVYFARGFTQPNSRITFAREGTSGGFTTVIEDDGPGGVQKTLLTNGKFQGNNTGEMSAQVAFAIVPILHTPRTERALVIGLGTGVSGRVVVDAGFKKVDVVEIADDIVEAARVHFSDVNGAFLEKENVEMIVEDGRNHLLRSDRTYDLITMEISSIWFAGAASLYAREFYELASKRISDDGILQQWIQFHHIAPDEILSVILTVRAVFEHVQVYFVGNQGIILASHQPIVRQQERVHFALTSDIMAFERELLLGFGDTIHTVENGRVLDEGEVNRLRAAEGARVLINTDENRYLEYATPRHNVERVHHLEPIIRSLFRFVDEEDRVPRLVRLKLVKDTPLASSD